MLKKALSEEHKQKISQSLKGKKKSERTIEHRKKLSLALKNKSYEERFGKEKAKIIAMKIRQSNKGKKRNFKNKEIWKKNLSNSLKGRKVWNKDKKGLQKAWNKKEIPKETIIDMYLNQYLSSTKIADIFSVSKSVILRILKENKIQLKETRSYIEGKTYEEIYGKEKGDKIKKNLSEKLKGRKVRPEIKIKRSEAVRKYYKNNPVSKERKEKQSEFMKKKW